MGNDSNSVKGVIHYSKKAFPMYWFLYDHGNLVSCLSADNDTEMTEIQQLVINANLECTHSLTGKCLEIKPAKYKDWERMHT